VRDYRILGDDITVSLSGERQEVAAPGVEGGSDGATGLFSMEPDGTEERVLPAAVREAPLARNSVLRIATPGGGGFGALADRTPEAEVQDVRDGRANKAE
jgi:N-methylhydantoinase B